METRGEGGRRGSSLLCLYISSSLAHTQLLLCCTHVPPPAKQPHPIKGFHHTDQSAAFILHSKGVAWSHVHIPVVLSIVEWVGVGVGLVLYRDFIRGGKMMGREESKAAFGTSTLLDVNPF